LYLLIKPYFIRIFLQNIYTSIVYDKKEQNYSTSIISLENSGSSLPASKSQSNSESDSPNEIIKGKTFSNERFHINFAQSSEISSFQYLQKYWHISGVHFKIDSSHKFTTLSGSNNRSYKTPVPIGSLFLPSLSVLHFFLVLTYESIYTQKKLDFIITY
jgi:hypothetical protein